jgi:hypothetical protein
MTAAGKRPTMDERPTDDEATWMRAGAWRNPITVRPHAEASRECRTPARRGLTNIRLLLPVRGPDH